MFERERGTSNDSLFSYKILIGTQNERLKSVLQVNGIFLDSHGGPYVVCCHNKSLLKRRYSALFIQKQEGNRGEELSLLTDPFFLRWMMNYT